MRDKRANYLLGVLASIPDRQHSPNKRKRMKTTDKKSLLKWNTILWLTAMISPAFLSIAFASTKFPWPMILPLLLLGPMLFSNKMLAQAIEAASDAPDPK